MLCPEDGLCLTEPSNQIQTTQASWKIGPDYRRFKAIRVSLLTTGQPDKDREAILTVEQAVTLPGQQQDFSPPAEVTYPISKDTAVDTLVEFELPRNTISGWYGYRQSVELLLKKAEGSLPFTITNVSFEFWD